VCERVCERVCDLDLRGSIRGGNPLDIDRPIHVVTLNKDRLILLSNDV